MLDHLVQLTRHECTNFRHYYYYYYYYCHDPIDLDEWTQVAALDILTRYCRLNFMDPAPGVEAAIKLQAKQRST